MSSKFVLCIYTNYRTMVVKQKFLFYLVCFKGWDRKGVEERERVGRKGEKWINKWIELKNKNGNVG